VGVIARFKSPSVCVCGSSNTTHLTCRILSALEDCRPGWPDAATWLAFDDVGETYDANYNEESDDDNESVDEEAMAMADEDEEAFDEDNKKEVKASIQADMEEEENFEERDDQYGAAIEHHDETGEWPEGFNPDHLFEQYLLHSPKMDEDGNRKDWHGLDDGDPLKYQAVTPHFDRAIRRVTNSSLKPSLYDPSFCR